MSRNGNHHGSGGIGTMGDKGPGSKSKDKKKKTKKGAAKTGDK